MGILASLALGLYVAAMPALVLLWLRWDAWLVLARKDEAAVHVAEAAEIAARAKSRSLISKLAEQAGPLERPNPLRKGSIRIVVADAAGDAEKGIAEATAAVEAARRIAAATLEGRGAAAPDPILAPFLSDFRPAAWYTKLLDLSGMLVLAALEVRRCC